MKTKPLLKMNSDSFSYLVVLQALEQLKRLHQSATGNSMQEIVGTIVTKQQVNVTHVTKVMSLDIVADLTGVMVMVIATVQMELSLISHLSKAVIIVFSNHELYP